MSPSQAKVNIKNTYITKRYKISAKKIFVVSLFASK